MTPGPPAVAAVAVAAALAKILAFTRNLKYRVMSTKFLACNRLKTYGIQPAVSSTLLLVHVVTFLIHHHRSCRPAGSHSSLHTPGWDLLRINPDKRRPMLHPQVRPLRVHTLAVILSLTLPARPQHSQRPVRLNPGRQHTILIPIRADLALRRKGNMGMRRGSNGKRDERLGRRKGGQLGSVARKRNMVEGMDLILVTPRLLDLLHPSPAARLGVIRRLRDMDRHRVVLLMDLLVLPLFLAALAMATLAALPKALRTPPNNPLMEDPLKARLGVDTDLRHQDKVDGADLDGETVLFSINMIESDI